MALGRLLRRHGGRDELQRLAGGLGDRRPVVQRRGDGALALQHRLGVVHDDFEPQGREPEMSAGRGHHRHGHGPAQGGVHRRRTARRGLQALVPWLAAAARVALGALVGAEGEARDHPGTDVCVSVCVLKAVSKSLDVS